MIELRLNSVEKRRLLGCADNTIFDKLHWGNGEVIIPEEQILYEMIKKAEDKIELSFTQLKILLNWIFETTAQGTILLNEDISILYKILTQLEKHREYIIRKYEQEIKEIQNQIDSINNIFGDAIKKEGKKIEEQQKEEESVLDNKLSKIVQQKEELEKYKNEIKAKLREEREKDISKGDSGKGEFVQKDKDFIDKIKEAKRVEKEMTQAKEFLKKVQKKVKGKKVF